jgi:hypothetical protein
MPIEKRQPGEAKAAATAGKIIGEAEKAKRDQAIALEREQRAAQLNAQKMAMEWESQKMLMRSQQEFGKEMRAKEWEVEKMSIRSRLDFEQEEKNRQTKIDGITTSILALDKAVESGRYTEAAVAPYRSKYETDLEIAKAGGTKTSPFIRPDKPVRPPSATRQKGEIEAQFELEGYTQQDLVELGLDPADFPGVGDMVITGFDDDGEPLVELAGSKRNKYGGYGATGSF